MIKRPNTNAQRLKRHKRVRGKISGTPERPRLNVFRSETNIYAQIIDDVNGHTLAAASSLEKDFQCDGDKKAAAKLVGQKVAERAKAKAEEALREKESQVEFARSQAKLARAMARLKVAKKHNRTSYNQH